MTEPSISAAPRHLPSTDFAAKNEFDPHFLAGLWKTDDRKITDRKVVSFGVVFGGGVAQ